MGGFLDTYWGMYLIQNFWHSAIAAAVADSALVAWRIRDPLLRQRFRLLVIVLPVVSYPAYQWLNPERGTAYFRLGALADSMRWMHLEVARGVTVAALLLVFLGLTTLVFVIQELLPILVHMLRFGGGRGEDDGGNEADPHPEALEKLMRATAGLPIGKGDVEVLVEDDVVLYSSTGFAPRVFVSTGTMEELDDDELQSAIAHEIAHIARSRRPVLIFAYVFRTLMFFNPVAMVEFRRVAQDEEKICDDMAVSMTGKPEALARVIDMMRPDPEARGPEVQAGGKMMRAAAALESYSHDALLRARVMRIRDGLFAHNERWLLPLASTGAAIAVLNYFVV